MVNTTTVGGDSDEFPIEDTDDESPIEKIDRMERLCRRIHPIIPKSSKGLFTFFDAILYEAERLHGKDAVITSLRFSALDCRYPSKSILQEYDTRKRYWNNGQRWNASNDSDYVGLVIFHSLLADEWFQDSRDEFEKMFEFVIPKVLSGVSSGSLERIMINLYKEKWEQRKKEIPTNVTNKMTVSVNNESRQNNIEDISSVIVKTEEFDHNEDAHTEKYTTDEFEWVEEDLNLSVDLEEIGSPMERLESEIEDIVEEPEFDVSVEDAFHLIVEPKKALVHESTPSGQVLINPVSFPYRINTLNITTPVEAE